MSCGWGGRSQTKHICGCRYASCRCCSFCLPGAKGVQRVVHGCPVPCYQQLYHWSQHPTAAAHSTPATHASASSFLRLTRTRVPYSHQRASGAAPSKPFVCRLQHQHKAFCLQHSSTSLCCSVGFPVAAESLSSCGVSLLLSSTGGSLWAIACARQKNGCMLCYQWDVLQLTRGSEAPLLLWCCCAAGACMCTFIMWFDHPQQKQKQTVLCIMCVSAVLF